MVKLTICLSAIFGISAVVGSTVSAGPGPVNELIMDMPLCDLKTTAYSGYLDISPNK